MDKLIKLSKDFVDGKIDHIAFRRELAYLFRTKSFFQDEMMEFAKAILSQAILKEKKL